MIITIDGPTASGKSSVAQALAKKLSAYKNSREVIVLGIPRGGIEVAAAVAKGLNAELSVIITKKIRGLFRINLK